MSNPAISSAEASAKETVQVYMHMKVADEIRADRDDERRKGRSSSVSTIAARIITRHYAKRLRAKGVQLLP